MSKEPKNVLELPLHARALLALRAAVKKAIAERLREGLPVYVMSKGKVVDLREVRKDRARQKRARQKKKVKAKRLTAKRKR